MELPEEGKEEVLKDLDEEEEKEANSVADGQMGEVSLKGFL